MNVGTKYYTLLYMNRYQDNSDGAALIMAVMVFSIKLNTCSSPHLPDAATHTAGFAPQHSVPICCWEANTYKLD